MHLIATLKAHATDNTSELTFNVYELPALSMFKVVCVEESHIEEFDNLRDAMLAAAAGVEGALS